MALIVFDASVLIALLDPADALNISARREFERVASEDLVIPASAWAETLVGPSRAGQLVQARARLQALAFRVTAIDARVAEQASQLRALHPILRLPEAFVLASADVLQAAELLTGDSKWRSLSRRVRVVGKGKSSAASTYREFLPVADRLYDEHLDELRREGELK